MPTLSAIDYLKLLKSILPEKELSDFLNNHLQTDLDQHNSIALLENQFQKLCGLNEVVAVSNESIACNCLLFALGVKASDLVVLSALASLETVSAVIQTGAIPIMLDITPDSCGVDQLVLDKALHEIGASVKLARKWLPRKGYQRIGTMKAMIQSHSFTNPEQIVPDLHQSSKLPVINVLGEMWQTMISIHEESLSPSFDLFSFSPGQRFPYMNCSMLATSDIVVADQVRQLRNLGCQAGESVQRQLMPGFAGMPGSIQAEIWSLCLLHMDDIKKQHLKVTNWFEERLAPIPGIEPCHWSMDDRPFPGRFTILLKDPSTRSEILQELDILGVMAKVHPVPVHLHPYMMEKFGYHLLDFPNTESFCEKGILLPFSHRMNERQVDFICRMVEQILD